MKFGSSLCLPLLATAMSKRAERALSAVNQRLASLAQLESELKSVEFRYGQEQLLRRADETAAIEEIVSGMREFVATYSRHVSFRCHQ